MRRILAAALLAGCAYSNEAILDDLAARAKAAPDAALDAAAAQGGAAPLPAPARAAALPMLQGKVPAVLGRINGVEMPLVLDTGTSHVILTAEGARAAGLYLPAGEAAVVVSPGHNTLHRVGAFESLEIGGTRIGPGAASVAVNERPGRWIGLGTDAYATVGCSVLSHFAVTFDFERREVRLAPAGRPGDGISLLAPVEIDGRSYALLVDSGATGLFVEPWAAVEMGLITPERAARHEAKGGRRSDARFTRVALDRVRVAGREFRDVDASVVNTFGDLVFPSGRRVGGLLGLKAFGPLVWTVDFGAGTLRVGP